MSITLTYSRIRSVSQDDTELNEVEQTGADPLSGGVNSISEKKILYCEFEVEEVAEPEIDPQMVLPNAKLFITWAMFLPTGLAVDFSKSVPNTGFSVQIPESIYAGGDAIEMPFYSLGITTPNSAKNIRCWFYFLTETTFAIEFEYYNTFDEDGYMTQAAKPNDWRFLSEYWTQQNTNEVTESIYNVEKDLRLITHLVSPDLTENDLKYSETQEFVLWTGSFAKIDSAGTLEDVDGDEILSLSSIEDTVIIFKMSTAENTFDRFYAKLITIQNDPDLDFIENYDLQENWIDAANVSYNAFKGPFTVTRFDVDGYYEIVFDIDKDYIEDGKTYRIMITAYDQGGAEYAGAFNRTTTSPPIPGTSLHSYCNTPCTSTYDDPTELLLTATLMDIDKEYTGNYLNCVIEERMRSKLIVDYSDNRWKNNLDCRLGNTVGSDTATSNDIRKYLTSVTLEIYTEDFDAAFNGTFKHVVDSRTMTKTQANNYNTDGIVFAFAGDVLTMTYDWRNRNEALVTNIASYFNDQPMMATSNQYWGGKLFYIKWKLNFFYYDFPKPFVDQLDIIQKMFVKDYDGTIVVTNDFDLDFVCPEETLCFDGTVVLVDPELYRLINIFELSPGQLYEAENWVPGELAQQQAAYFNTQDVDYTGGDAHFCVNPSTLNINQTYNLSILAKKI